MKLANAQKTLLITPGDYPATLALAVCAPGKKDSSSTNINVTFDVVLQSGRTVKTWDLLPDIDKNPRVFFRYDQYIQALGLTLSPDFDLTSRSFAAELNKAVNEQVGVTLTIAIEESPQYGPRNVIKRISAMSLDMIQHVARLERHDSETDAPAQPSAKSAVGAQSSPDEDPELI